MKTRKTAKAMRKYPDLLFQYTFSLDNILMVDVSWGFAVRCGIFLNN